MIILEGADRTGKTVLANKLADHYGLSIIKYGVPKGDPIPEYVKHLVDVNCEILDRSWYGEIPYSIVKRRPRYMNYLELRILDLMTMSWPHIVLYCRPTREEAQDRLKLEPDDYINSIELNKLYEEFDNLFENIHANTMIINPFKEDDIYKINDTLVNSPLMVSLNKVVSAEAWRFARGYHENANFVPGIGTLEPRILFVGERYNPRAPYQITFWSPSGEYLFKCLDKSGVNPALCHFTNSISQDVTPISAEQIRYLSPRKIVCLGEVAYSNVCNAGLNSMTNIVKVPHPQYWKRFHAVDIDSYVKMLEDACKF